MLQIDSHGRFRPSGTCSPSPVHSTRTEWDSTVSVHVETRMPKWSYGMLQRILFPCIYPTLHHDSYCWVGLLDRFSELGSSECIRSAEDSPPFKGRPVTPSRLTQLNWD